MNVSVVIPTYMPKKRLLSKIVESVKKQKFPGEIEVIVVDIGSGLARAMNFGIRKAKNEMIVTIPQDCIPSSEYWLTELIAPMKDKKVVGCASKVELPYDFWNKFDPIAKILSAKEQQVRLTRMDGKGCAYRKSILQKIGMFDQKTFRTAGEDFDIFMKLSKIGKIAYTDAKIIHWHHHTWKNRIWKEKQLSNGFGTVARVYGKQMPWRHYGFMKSIPFFSWPLFLWGLPVKKIGIWLSLLAIPVYLPVSLLYSYGFWKGFLMGKQTI